MVIVRGRAEAGGLRMVRMVRMVLLGLVVVVLTAARIAHAGGTRPVVSSFSVNGTVADGGVAPPHLDGGNRAALRDLMDGGTSQRQQQLGGTVEECVESIRRARSGSESFVPPGSQEWCECIVADPPTLRPRQSEESRADWDRAFDRCRALVLDGSGINTVDICRGMFSFFFPANLRAYYHSFCGRLCTRNPSAEYRYIPSGYSYADGLDLGETCDSQCARDVMPGYCSKYLLTYSGTVPYSYRNLVYFYSRSTRTIAVNGELAAQQKYFSSRRRTSTTQPEVAMAVCSALKPFLGCYNACCNYPRAFDLMQICCSADGNGKAVFDCDRAVGDPLSGPLEPADCEEEEPEDPCMGTCEGDRQCVVSGNGVPFCVTCSAFMKKKGPKVNVECCAYDEEKMRCVSAIKGTSISKCKRDQNIFIIDDEGDRTAVTFMKSTGYACGNPRDFRKNRKACRMVVKANGEAKCFEKK